MKTLLWTLGVQPQGGPRSALRHPAASPLRRSACSPHNARRSAPRRPAFSPSRPAGRRTQRAR